MAIPEHPNNRKERYLAKIAGQAGASIPAHPHTREEMYLDAIAQKDNGITLYWHSLQIQWIYQNANVAYIVILSSHENPYTKEEILEFVNEGGVFPVMCGLYVESEVMYDPIIIQSQSQEDRFAIQVQKRNLSEGGPVRGNRDVYLNQIRVIDTVTKIG